VTTTPPASDADAPPEPGSLEGQTANRRFVELVLDNLSAWTVIAAAIAFLYLVWATVEILGRFLESIPSVGP
jgi:hypothetical protein